MRRKPIQVTVESILEAAGKLDEFRQALDTGETFHLRIENGSWVPLVIEVTWQREVSLAHYIYEHGDSIRDPEIVFNPSSWMAVEITQDLSGMYQRVPPGKYSPGIEELARIWAKNLRNQGFVEAAKKLRGLEPEQAD